MPARQGRKVFVYNVSARFADAAMMGNPYSSRSGLGGLDEAKKADPGERQHRIEDTDEPPHLCGMPVHEPERDRERRKDPTDAVDLEACTLEQLAKLPKRSIARMTLYPRRPRQPPRQQKLDTAMEVGQVRNAEDEPAPAF